MTLAGLGPAAGLLCVTTILSQGSGKLLLHIKTLMSVKMPTEDPRLLYKPARAQGQPVSMMRAGAFDDCFENNLCYLAEANRQTFTSSTLTRACVREKQKTSKLRLWCWALWVPVLLPAV